jgi:hypothetical protein
LLDATAVTRPARLSLRSPYPRSAWCSVANGILPRWPICAAAQRADGLTVCTVAGRPNPSVQVNVTLMTDSSAARDVGPLKRLLAPRECTDDEHG